MSYSRIFSRKRGFSRGRGAKTLKITLKILKSWPKPWKYPKNMLFGKPIRGPLCHPLWTPMVCITNFSALSETKTSQIQSFYWLFWWAAYKRGLYVHWRLGVHSTKFANKLFFLQLNSIHTAFLHPPVFSVSLVCEKELNLMLKVRETSSQGAMGLSLRGTDFFLPIR